MTTAQFPSRDEAQKRQRNDATLDVERAKRADSVRNAIAITEMEGGQPSAFCRELLILYENGEISGAEMRKRILGKARGRDLVVGTTSSDVLQDLDQKLGEHARRSFCRPAGCEHRAQSMVPKSQSSKTRFSLPS